MASGVRPQHTAVASLRVPLSATFQPGPLPKYQPREIARCADSGWGQGHISELRRGSQRSDNRCLRSFAQFFQHATQAANCFVNFIFNCLTDTAGCCLLNHTSGQLTDNDFSDLSGGATFAATDIVERDCG